MNLSEKKYTNSLVNQTSPYLLQHANNPVNWYPWGAEALEKAKTENKLLLISIGYSACHWCHVMEQESFENEEIAKIMNDNYVCIKVDREERPDIDNLYMNAVQLIAGNGGWPLNCFALPDTQPVYGGTYFRPEHWIQVLSNLTQSYKENPEKFENAAKEIKKGILSTELISTKAELKKFSISDLKNSVDSIKKYFDKNEGGMNQAPKFPMSTSLNFLLNYYYYSKDSDILNHLNLTLQKMANGGIYDQIGGGFSRYSTDEQWLVPHFEKMLYDNGQLISLYSKAYKLTKNQLYKKVVYETINFVKRELSSPEGGFYSALDADSEGIEGKYYVWSKSEISKILGSDSDFFCDLFNVSEKGNWDESNILNITNNLTYFLQKYSLTVEELSFKITQLSNLLLNEREKRIKPGLDNKILTSWNALMLCGLIDAYEAFSEVSFLETAEKNANFIMSNMWIENNGLLRTPKNSTQIRGFLDDYALTIKAFISIYRNSMNEKYLVFAKKLTDFVLIHFSDYETDTFYYTDDFNSELIVRKKEISDNVIASSNSVMAENLFILSFIYSNHKYFEISKQMLSNFYENITKRLLYFENWANLFLSFSNNPYEVVITGIDSKNILKTINQQFRPDLLLIASNKISEIPIFENRIIENKTQIYICKDNVCMQPVYKIEDVLKNIVN